MVSVVSSVWVIHDLWLAHGHLLCCLHTLHLPTWWFQLLPKPRSPQWWRRGQSVKDDTAFQTPIKTFYFSKTTGQAQEKYTVQYQYNRVKVLVSHELLCVNWEVQQQHLSVHSSIRKWSIGCKRDFQLEQHSSRPLHINERYWGVCQLPEQERTAPADKEKQS